jgi:hypothetical protein
MRNPDTTLDSIWPTVVQTASSLRLSGPSSHAHSATVQRRPDRGPQGARREPCNWCGAPGHDESQCYSKDPANLLLHPPGQGWPDRFVPERFRLKYHSPLPRNPNANQAPRQQTAHNVATPPMLPLDSFSLDNRDHRWVMDSGASMHISFDVTNFLTLELNPRFALPTVIFGDNNQLTATGIGSVQFQLLGIDGPSTTMILDDTCSWAPAPL